MSKLPSCVKLVFLGLAPFFLFGCAVGNQYMYKAEDVGLPLNTRDEAISVGVGVKDDRFYVLNGNKPPTFVGLQRGGFGNPFNVTTASNRPFAADVADILVNMLGRYGYKADVKRDDATLEAFTMEIEGKDLSKAVFLEIREWKTDIYASVTLHYDLELLVLDGEGTALARSVQSGKEPIGGSTINPSANGVKASQALATKLSYLFNNPEIQAALE